MNIAFFKGLIITLLFAFVAFSCKRTEYICPAYQSVFYLDKDAGKKQFATKMGPDSTPLDLNLKLKDEHLIAKYIPYKQKEKMIATIPMVTIFNKPGKEDSLDKMQFAAKDSVLKEKFRQGPALPVIEKDEDVEGDDLPDRPIDTDTSDSPSENLPLVPTKEQATPKVKGEETDTPPVEVVVKQNEPTVPKIPQPAKVVNPQKQTPLKGGQKPVPKGKKK